MAELKCGTQAAWNSRKKSVEHFPVGLQVRRKLKQYWAKPVSTRQRFNRTQKSLYKIFSVLETFDVSDDLVGLNAETKFRRAFVEPLFDSGFLHQLAKSEIDFDGIKLRGVVLEKVLLGKLFGIELGLPARIRPSGGTSE